MNLRGIGVRVGLTAGVQVELGQGAATSPTWLDLVAPDCRLNRLDAVERWSVSCNGPPPGLVNQQETYLSLIIGGG